MAAPKVVLANMNQKTLLMIKNYKDATLFFLFLFLQHYSKDYFPSRQSALRYFSDFADKFKLNIKYNTNVNDIHQQQNGDIVMKDQHGQVYKCK